MNAKLIECCTAADQNAGTWRINQTNISGGGGEDEEEGNDEEGKDDEGKDDEGNDADID